MASNFEYRPKQDQASGYRHNVPRTQSSSDDNSDEDTPLWKQKKEKYFRKQDETPMSVSQGSTGPNTQTSSVTTKKKNYNIWGSVLTEEDLTQTFKTTAVDKPNELSYNERNVESYDFTKKYIDERPALEDVPEAIHDPFQSVLSAAPGPRRGREIIDYNDTVSKTKETNDLRGNLQKAHQSRKRKADAGWDSQQRSGGVHGRLGAKKVTTTKLGEIDLSLDMEAQELSKKIAEFLHEPKVELIERIVEHLGKDVAIRILKATKDVEETGGMYTMDGSRRRTPGGVYLTLMKQQPEFNNQVRKLIFIEEEAEKQKLKKEKKKRNQAKKKRLAQQRNDSASKSRSRSNSNSRSKSPSHKLKAEDEMEDDQERQNRDQKIKKRGRHRRRQRKSQQHESSEDSSDDYEDLDRQTSNTSKPFNFEDELEAAKKLILEKAKARAQVDNNEEMEDEEAQGQDKENVSEMADLDSAEANVVDIEFGE